MMKEFALGYLKEIIYSFRLNILVILLCLIFSISVFFLLYSQGGNNYQELGQEAIQSYLVEDDKNIVTCNSSENGLISFFTDPYRQIDRKTYYFYGAAILFLLIVGAALFYNFVREKRIIKKIKQYTETVSFLGNIYYAIYRVNYQNNTYEILKMMPELQEAVKNITEYDKFLKNIGKTIEPSAREDFLHFFSAANIKKLVAGSIHEYGGEFQRRFGEKYEWVNVRLIVDNKVNSDEVIVCFSKAGDEKSQQLKQIELLRFAQQSALRSANARNIFFSKMSHEMRTPLNAIIGLSDLAKEHCHTYEEVFPYLEKINASSKQLLKQINHILDISHEEHDKSDGDISEIDLKKCIDECLNGYFVKASDEQKRFTVEYYIHNQFVFASCFRINQIINNIVSNAFKYSRAGDSISVRVKQVDKQKNSRYQIDVTDTGLGMSQDFQNKIFIPYERKVRFAAKNELGSGIGMSIVKNIIHNMDGEITIKSELDKGTTVTVVLPFETADSVFVPDNIMDDIDKALKNLNILLVEDNSINMQIATKLLEVKGCNVYKAWNGQDAVSEFETLSSGFFDIILMDMQMPVMDGLEAAKAIRNMDKEDAKTVPIVALTANNFAEDIAATAIAGMNAHVAKPIDTKILYKTIYELVTVYRGKYSY